MTPDEQLAALAISVERIARSQESQATQLRSIAVEQVSVRAAVTALRSAQKPTGAWFTDWMVVGEPAIAVALLREVDSWVQQVFRHYQPMPDCWAWHPAVVAELVACQAAHGAATGEGAPPAAPADWHIRYLATSVRTVRTRLAECGRASGHLATYGVDRSRLDDLATWWASRLTDPTAPEPGLTPMET